jgi:hypothetical protein
MSVNRYQGINFGVYNKPFNMDAITLERINDKIGKANDAAIDGNNIQHFRALKTVYNNSQFKFEPEEKSKMMKKITNLNSMFKNRPSSRQGAQQFYNQQIDIIEENIFEFEGELIELLYKHDLIHLKKLKSLPIDQEVEMDYE